MYEPTLSRILKELRPSEKTKTMVENLSRELVREIGEILNELAPGCSVEIEGSVAKGTYLKNSHDIDIFAFFPVKTPRETLEEITLKLGRRWAEGRGAPYQISYAEHPYVTVTLLHEGLTFEVDIVGAYFIKSTSKLKSAVDRTRFHTEYVRSKINPELKGQILLTKQFMRGTGVYGSEVRVGGFSGLLCEVLTIGYGSFLNLIRSAGDWRPGQVIDVENLNSSAQDFKAPLIVIDPTDGRRNAGAAVSLDKMSNLIHAARCFLKSPSERFFFPKTRKPLAEAELRRLLKRRGTRIFIIEFEKPEVIDDILYPQMERMITSLRGQFEEFGFSLIGPNNNSVCEEEGIIHILLELGVFSLPRIEKRYGPRMDREEDSKKFLDKHSDIHPYLEGGKWCVDAPRRFSDAKDLLIHILSDNPQGILPTHVAGALAKGWNLRTDEEAILSSGRAARLMLTEHFVRLFPWQVE